jgi:uncharacterized membrane protein
VLAASVDLVIEPVAVRAGLWRWTPPGPWLGVPLGNTVAWFVIVTSWVLGLERDRADVALPRTALRRAALGILAVGALALVGTLWQAFEVEPAATAGAGWVMAGLLAAGAALVLTRRPVTRSREETVGARLAVAGGPLPEVILLVLVAAFGGQAALRAGRAAHALLEKVLQVEQRAVLGRAQDLQLLAGQAVARVEAHRGLHLAQRARPLLHHLVVEPELVVDVRVVRVEAERFQELTLGLLGRAREAGQRDGQPHAVRGDFRL